MQIRDFEEAPGAPLALGAFGKVCFARACIELGLLVRCDKHGSRNPKAWAERRRRTSASAQRQRPDR